MRSIAGPEFIVEPYVDHLDVTIVARELITRRVFSDTRCRNSKGLVIKPDKIIRQAAPTNSARKPTRRLHLKSIENCCC